MIELAISILSIVFVLAASLTGLYIVFRMGQEKGFGHAILGFIFVPYAFIWGWMNASRLKIADIMIFWTFVGIASVVFPLAIGLTTGLQAVSSPGQVFSGDLPDPVFTDDVRRHGGIALGSQVQGHQIGRAHV